MSVNKDADGDTVGLDQEKDGAGPPVALDPASLTETAKQENDDVEADIARVVTAHSVKVPRERRRGLFGRCAVVDEVEEPLTYSKHHKNLIVFTVATAALNAPFGSAIFLPSVNQIAKDFNTSESIVSLTVAFYMLALGIGPIFWSRSSEIYGRRSVYIISFALNTVFSLASGFSSSIGMLVAFRLLSGMSSASVQSVGAGTISDIYISNQRGQAFGYFYMGPLLGPCLGPIVGGALSQRFGWTSTMWFLTVLSFLQLIFILLMLPETMRNVSPDTSRASVRHHLYNIFVSPLRSLRLLTFPPVLMATLENSIIFGTLYVINITISVGFAQPPYSYPTSTVGLFYLPNSVGYILGSVVGGRWSDRILKREAKRKNHGVEIPENRIGINALIGCVGMIGGLLIFGWTFQAKVIVAGPLVGTFIFGFCLMLVFSTTNTYLVDSVSGKSSSAMAVNNLVRSTFSCVGTVVSEPLLQALGGGWLYTMLAILNVLFAVTLCIIHYRGPKLRERFDVHKFDTL